MEGFNGALESRVGAFSYDMDEHTQTVSHIPVESATHLPFAQDVVS